MSLSKNTKQAAAKKFQRGIPIDNAQEYYGPKQFWSDRYGLRGEIRYFPQERRLFFVLTSSKQDKYLTASPVFLMISPGDIPDYKLFISKKYQSIKID